MSLTSCALAIFALAACGTNQKAIQGKVGKLHCPKGQFRQGSTTREHTATLNSKASVEEVDALVCLFGSGKV